MNFAQYYPLDVVNGKGTRCTLFVSGCEHHCKGCYNKSTWNPESGYPYTEELEEQIIKDLTNTNIPRRGLSISGGDPLAPYNLPTIIGLCEKVKGLCPSKDIWLWIGYEWENLTEEQKKILPYIDILIDGPFIENLKDPTLVWRGSSNQRIIDVPNSLSTKSLVFSEYYYTRKSTAILYERRT